jgi:deoxyribose-phosphate aldolase
VPALFSIAVGADHNGVELKKALLDHLTGLGHATRDCGTQGKEPADYPRTARAVADLVATGVCRFGIVIDGAGIGSAMAANKVRGVRAAACYSEDLARNAREHNDANVLSLGAGMVTVEEARRIVDVFLASECTGERHRRRVGMIEETKGESPGAGLSAEDMLRITARVRDLLAADDAGPESEEPSLAPEQIAALIDHTLLRPEATPADIERLCEEARRHSFYSVCVNPAYVRHVRALLEGSAVRVCCVVGFPLGAQPPEIKALEARRALREGAREIDTVINIGALKSHDDETVWKDIRTVVEACRDGRALCKVILETALLTDDEKVRACRLAMRAGADFVKTSTGFSSGGATVEDVALMSRTVAPKRLGVKASGGIRSLADVRRMVRAGATRIGTSSSVKIIEEAEASSERG